MDDYSDNLYRFVLKNIKDEEKAKDIIQDTFEKFWHKKDAVQPGKEKSYLFTIAYHAFIDQTRREKKMGSFKEVKEEEFFENSHYSDLQEVLHQAINQLPEDQKAVIMLRDYEGYAYDEIAEITNLRRIVIKYCVIKMDG